ncbi:MAG: protein kinase [Alphaproteobacteria bacterium]|nr:protein kinase [Alphaproteobacteria bacterium]
MLRQAFTRAARKDGAEDVGFLDAVLRERPDLQGQPHSFPSEGQKGHTVIIGEEVFKGPKQRSGACMDDFMTECRTLKALDGKKITAAVPRITSEGRDFLFFGMTRVPGVTMGGDYSTKLSREEQAALAKDIVNFTIEFARAMPPQGGKFAVHDDLYYNNILIDPETKRLAGVIDFGIVAYKTADEWQPVSDFKGRPFGDMLQDEFNRRKDEFPKAPSLKERFAAALPDGVHGDVSGDAPAGDASQDLPSWPPPAPVGSKWGAFLRRLF